MNRTLGFCYQRERSVSTMEPRGLRSSSFRSALRQKCFRFKQ